MKPLPRRQVPSSWFRATLRRFWRRAPPLCEDFPAWCERHKIAMETIGDGGWRSRPLPAPGSSTPPEFFLYQRFWQPPRFVTEIRRATICGDNGYIVLPDGRFLVEVAWEPKHIRCHPAYFTRHSRRPRLKHGAFFSCLLFWHQGYYHWLHDVVARLHKVLERLPDDVTFLVPANLRDYQWRAVEIAGIPRSRCLTYDGREPWLLERLYHATPAAHCGDHDPQAVAWIQRRFQEFVGANQAPPGDRIYISRRRAGYRRLANEAEITGILAQFGYRIVIAEDYPFDEQIRIFSCATHVIGCHGAGLSNIVFCQPDATLIEMFEPTIVRPCYWSLASALNFRYFCLLAESVPNLQGDPDLKVNPDALRKLLEWAETRSHAAPPPRREPFSA